MTLKAIIRLVITLTMPLGCAGNSAEVSSIGIEEHISVDTASNSARTWLAPELQTRHFRILFYGYDTVYYRLMAMKPNQSSDSIVYWLLLDANYGGTVRHYELAKLAVGASYPTSHRNHETERCQLFGSIVSSCLYRDRADVELSQADLEAGRQSGLTLTLGSSDKDYERIEMSAQYVDGFLRAVQKNP